MSDEDYWWVTLVDTGNDDEQSQGANQEGDEEGHNQYAWFARLLWRLDRDKETRLIPWHTDPEQHLMIALADPDMAKKPSNMPAGIWYWVTNASENDESGWYVLIMFLDRGIHGAARQAFSLGLSDTIDRLNRANTGRKLKMGTYVETQVSAAAFKRIRPLLHPNVRHMAETRGSRRTNALFIMRFPILLEERTVQEPQ